MRAKAKLRNKGFSTVEALLMLLIVGALVAGLIWIYARPNAKDPETARSENHTSQQELSAGSPEALDVPVAPGITSPSDLDKAITAIDSLDIGASNHDDRLLLEDSQEVL